jgi:uncharacterized membrane protein
MRPTLLALALSVLALAACKKDAPAATTEATPAPPAATAAPAPQPEPTNARDICKKKFATACAIPCETKATQTEKDPAKLKLLKDRCMIGCLEQAETACPRTH